MQRSWIYALAALSLLGGSLSAVAATSARIATSDVVVDLKAGAEAPRLASLSGAGNQTRWMSAAGAHLPATVEVDGQIVPLAWRHQPQLDKVDAQRAVFVYDSVEPHLRMSWIWEARAAFGPVEHHVSIANLSGKDLWLPLIDSLGVRWTLAGHGPLTNFYVEKGADTPSPEGTHLSPIDDGYEWNGFSSTYARPVKGQSREIIPAEFIYDSSGAHNGWFAGIEFSGRTRVHLQRSGDQLSSSLGLNPDPGPYRTRLAKDDAFVTPSAFLGAFSGGPDGAGNELRKWVRAVLGNPNAWKNPNYPLTVNNSWGSGMAVDEALALRMIDRSRELGLEMFHVDAGWFRGVGDWVPDPVKFPHGLAYVADYAHKNGLRFGLWIDWTQAGVSTEPGALNVHDVKASDWLVHDVAPDWKPQPFKGQTIDIGLPAAADFANATVKHVVESYHLDMLEHDGYVLAQGCVRDDHPHAPPLMSTMKVTHDWGSDFVDASNSTDVSYYSVRAYYKIYEGLRREHPKLLLEICNDGGRMVDFGSAAHGDYFSITDTYDPLSNRRAFYDTSYVLPAAMLECYIEKWPVPTKANFLYMLRSGMMGWMTIMLDTNAWSPEQREAAKDSIRLYKEKLRPLIREADLYHISPRPDGVHWDAVEYWQPRTKQGVVYAFHGSETGDGSHSFVLAGLSQDKHYRLHFEDGSSADQEAAGSELMQSGLKVNLPAALSSELVFLSEIPTNKK
jgi:alpha-galactosidase